METAQPKCVIRCYCWQDALFSRSPSAQKKGIYDMGKLETKSFENSSPQEVVKQEVSKEYSATNKYNWAKHLLRFKGLKFIILW